MAIYTDQEVLRLFRTIPGVGKSVARDLYDLGLRTLSEISKCDPEELYARFCDLRGIRVDRCMLYVFRCAVYYTSRDSHDPELLKWWNWKD